MAKGTTATVTAFAKAEGVARSSVWKWSRRGLPRLADGGVPVVEGRRWVRENVNRQRRQGGRAGAGPSLLGAQRRKLSAEALQEEIRARDLASSLVEVEDARRVWHEHVAHVKRVFLRLPAELAPKLAPLTSPIEVQAALDREVRKALYELATYEPLTMEGQR